MDGIKLILKQNVLGWFPFYVTEGFQDIFFNHCCNCPSYYYFFFFTEMKKPKVTPVSTGSQSKCLFYKKSLKKANDSYVTMMASVNVNGDEVVGTDIKQEAPCGFKFGFSIPTSCDSKTEIDNKMTVKSDIDGTGMCQGRDIVNIKCEGSDIITTKFVMPKTDNNFRFNFDLPP